jgi:hypothetical protein
MGDIEVAIEMFQPEVDVVNFAPEDGLMLVTQIWYLVSSFHLRFGRVDLNIM